jgi:pimeloyl-ACP methyl ester carboxylesterase
MLRSAVALCAGIACLVMTAPAASAQTTVEPPVTVAGVSQYKVNGVAVKKYTPTTPNGAPPVVMVHGGAHGKWAFDRYAQVLSSSGYTVHALDWLHHGDSNTLPMSTFLNRSILDVTHGEIRDVVVPLGKAPILIGHSMGGLASLAYAATYPVSRLVLIAPVLPSSVGAPPIDIPVDWNQPVGPFPLEVAQQLFYPALDLAGVQLAHSQLVGESPRAVWEATRWTINVGYHAVTAPEFVISAELDSLTPPDWVNVLANMLGAQYQFVPGVGHSDLLLKEPQATQIATQIDTWLGW